MNMKIVLLSLEVSANFSLRILLSVNEIYYLILKVFKIFMSIYLLQGNGSIIIS